MPYLLDTPTFIAALRGQPTVRAWLERTPLSELVLSPIVLGEVELAVARSAEAQRLQALLAELTARLPLARMSAEVSGHYARLRAQLEQAGNLLGDNLLWTAAHALAQDAILVTTTPQAFAAVPDLAVEDWLAAPPR